MFPTSVWVPTEADPEISFQYKLLTPIWKFQRTPARKGSDVGRKSTYYMVIKPVTMMCTWNLISQGILRNDIKCVSQNYLMLRLRELGYLYIHCHW